MDFIKRTERLIGAEGVERLRNAKVIIFGIGGVGGYTLEVIARSAVGEITIVDADRVEASNINRQIIALHSTINKPKVEVAKRRIQDINPECKVDIFEMFYSASNADSINLENYDYIIDCIDSVPSKMELIERATKIGKPLICAMGAGNKIDPTMLRVTDIYKTAIDPLAKTIRKRCRELGIQSLKAVWSAEQPLPSQCQDGKNIIASNASVPAAMGILIGSEVINDLIS